MHVAMYSIQSSFCTECPLPSSSDTDLICAGDFVQPLASLLCLGGVEVSGPGRVWKAESRLCWQGIRMRDTHGDAETVAEPPTLQRCARAELLHRVHTDGIVKSPHILVLRRSSGCSRDDVPYSHEKMLNQRSAAAHWPPNNGSEASWK